MFSGIRQRIARIKAHPDVQELQQNSRELLAQELRRLNRKLKARLRETPVEPLCNR